ncbi:hypothetical protein D4764_03G0012290, partial [Takifugu flavidus]
SGDSHQDDICLSFELLDVDPRTYMNQVNFTSWRRGSRPAKRQKHHPATALATRWQLQHVDSGTQTPNIVNPVPSSVPRWTLKTADRYECETNTTIVNTPGPFHCFDDIRKALTYPSFWIRSRPGRASTACGRSPPSIPRNKGGS